MKKKYRDIVVDDVVYAWAVREWLWPGAQLRIWHKTRGKVPWCELDFELTEGAMTPKRVQELILKLKRHPDSREFLIDPRSTYRCSLSEFLNP